ncbi:MAG: hypothetical protein EBY76_12675 [Betaproteobacteria bacterium]|nr:hypothetical protein [Betaproteobacteria bacterium]
MHSTCFGLSDQSQTRRELLALLNQGGLLYLESDRSWAQALEQTSGSSREQLASCLRLIRQAKAGAVHYHLLQRHNDSGQATS